MPSIRAERVFLHYPVFAARKPPDEPDATEPTETAAEVHAGALIKSERGGQRQIAALDDISFALGPGQRLGLVGRNGSGKSTLLRVLGGIYEPSAGRVDVDGVISPLFSVGLGTRADSSGRENIILRGLLRGLTRKEAAARIPEIAKFSGLQDFLDMPVRTYSTGMAMRLSFAIATTFSPEILLLDEWIGAGDAEFQKKARERMRQLVAHAGITVIASHNRSLLRNVCDVALWLDRGVMRAFGPIDEVYDAVDADKAERQRRAKAGLPPPPVERMRPPPAPATSAAPAP